jgi:exopolysaccharide biosynthesis protein
MVLSVSTPVLTKLAPVEKGALIRISTATTPDLKGVRTAIGGGPALLMAGKVVPLKKPDKPSASLAYSERSLFERHPRSALGWNERYFFFIEVDGRQKNLSMGMTLAELSDYMIKLGCTDGMNLDGGGSATIWLNGKVMNSPCFGYLRNTATTFVLVRKDKL